MKGFLNIWSKLALLILLLVYACDGNSEITKLRKDVRKLKDASVRLAPGMDGYRVIRHDLGSATFSLKEIRADATGSVITLEIGNLTSVDITGTSMMISYPDDAIERSSEYDVQQTLAAGKATKVHFTLEGVKPSGLSYIHVSHFQPKGIRLIQAN